MHQTGTKNIEASFLKLVGGVAEWTTKP
jgi:hypothetical protein